MERSKPYSELAQSVASGRPLRRTVLTFDRGPDRLSESRTHQEAAYGKRVLVVDNSTIFNSAKDESCRRKGRAASGQVRIDFDALLQLALAGRSLARAFVVDSIPPERLVTTTASRPRAPARIPASAPE